MPDNYNALYPAPPQPNQGMLTGDPSRMLQILPGLADFQARKAVGNALQQSTDSTGNFDPGGFAARVARDPAASLRAGEATQLAQEQRQKQFDLAVSQRQQLGRIYSALANKPDLNTADVMDYVTRMSRGLGIQNIPLLLGHKDYLVNAPPPVPMKGETMAQAKQRQLKSRLSDIVMDTLGPEFTMTPAQGGTIPGGDLVGTRPLVGTGDIVRGTIAGGPAASGGGAGVVGLPTGTDQDTAAMKEDQVRSAMYQSEVFPWEQALEKLRALGPGGTGPGSKGRQEFESFVFSMAPSIAKLAGIDPQKIKNYDEAEKYLANATQQRANNLGAQNELGLRTAITGSPNVGISQMAAEDVTKMSIAVQRMEHMQRLEAAQKGPVGYLTRKSQAVGNYDPRAFALDMLDGDQIAKMTKGMSAAERAKFNASVHAAVKAGVMKNPFQQ